MTSGTALQIKFSGVTALRYQIAGWRSRLLQVHPDHMRIARSAMRVSLFVLIGKCAGAFKEMAIAYRYGINHVVDAYQLTISLVVWLPTTLVTVLAVILVPTMVKLRASSKEEQERFLGELDVVAVVVGVIFAALLYLCWPFVLNFMAGNLSEETRVMSYRMMLGTAPVGVLLLTICVHSARLQAHGRHVNTLLECVPAVVLLVFVLVWRNSTSLLPLICGTTLGYLLQALTLGVLSHRVDKVRARFSLSLRSPQWRPMCRSVGVFMIGQLIMSFCTPLDQYFVAGLGDGSNATLGYANRVLALLISMGALAIGRATLPVLSEIMSGGDQDRARRTALMWAGLMFAIGVLVVAIVWPLAPFGVGLLFQRGAFNAADTAAVSSLVRWGLIQIPCYFAVLALVQLLASQGRFKAMAIVAISNFVVKAIANFALVRYFGVAGVLIATGIMSFSSFGCYLLLVRFDRSDQTRAGAA
jgi:putative peptidoglycan lipid II flippase